MKTHYFSILAFSLSIIISFVSYSQRNEWYNHSSYTNEGIEFIKNGERIYALYNNEASGEQPVFNFNTIYSIDTSGLSLIDAFDFVARNVNVHEYDEDSSTVVLSNLFYYHMDGPGAVVSKIGNSTLTNEFNNIQGTVCIDYFRNASYAYHFEPEWDNSSYFKRVDSSGKIVDTFNIPFRKGLKFIKSTRNEPIYFYHANTIYVIRDYSTFEEIMVFSGRINKVIDQPHKNRYILSTDSSLYIVNSSLDTILDEIAFEHQISDFATDQDDIYVLLDEQGTKVYKVTLEPTISRRALHLLLEDYHYRKVFYNRGLFLEGAYKGKSVVHRYDENKTLTTNRRDLGIVSASITKVRNKRYIYTYFIEVTVMNTGSQEVHNFSYNTCLHHFNHEGKISPGEEIILKDTIRNLDANLESSVVTICGVDYRIDADITNNTKSVDIMVRTEELPHSTSSFYPNPAKGRLFFTTPSSIEEIIISNTNGNTVLTTAKPLGNSIDIAGLSPGIYLVATKERQKSSIRKLVVLR